MDFPEGLLIRRADPTDAAPLAELAARTFLETFGPDNRPEDMARHLERSFGVDRQRDEIAAADLRTLVAVTEDGLVGYAQLRWGAPPVDVGSADPIELWRFYVDRSWHGRGVAQRLMEAVLTESRAMGAGALWLGVWERNFRAAAFYRKFGFAPVGTQAFLLGEDRQTDLVLARRLGDPPNPLARHGGLSYLHLPAREAEASARFYERVLGWTIDRRPGGVRFSTPDGLLIGGFGGDGPSAGIVPWFYVDGIEAAIERVGASGGRVLEALREEGDIRVVEVEDPAGNRLGLWQFVNAD